MFKVYLQGSYFKTNQLEAFEKSAPDMVFNQLSEINVSLIS